MPATFLHVCAFMFTMLFCFCCAWVLKLTNKVTCCNPLGKYMRAHIYMVTCACLRTHTLPRHCLAGSVPQMGESGDGMLPERLL